MLLWRAYEFTFKHINARISEWFFRHNVVEIFSVDLASIAGSSLKHFFQLLNTHRLAQLFCNSFDIVHIDWSCFVIVKQIEYLVDSVLNQIKFTLDSLSPNLEVIASKNSSKSISRPSLSSYVIMWKMVGFLDSKPRLCMADLSYLYVEFGTLGLFFLWLQCRRDWRPIWVPRFSLPLVLVFQFSF